MKKILPIGCAVFLGLALIVGLVLFTSYNRLVSLEEGVDAAWSQVENVYQRRADLIPNLVETVKGARDFERETLESVVEARSRVGQVQLPSGGGAPSAEQLQEYLSAQDGLSSALSRLLVVVERYPELKATQNFRDLQSQLEGTENRIATERRRFNEATREYNAAIRRLPGALVASLFGFERKVYFEAIEGAEAPPAVQF